MLTLALTLPTAAALRAAARRAGLGGLIAIGSDNDRQSITQAIGAVDDHALAG